jgi:hypothetical protein
LKHNADAALQLVCVTRGINAENRHISPVAKAKPFENFHSRALTSPVGSKHGEDVAGLDLKVDALNGANIAITFRELMNVDDG